MFCTDECILDSYWMEFSTTSITSKENSIVTNPKLSKSHFQTCCYNTQYRSLITSGQFAGSVLTNLFTLFLSYSSYRRIPFQYVSKFTSKIFPFVDLVINAVYQPLQLVNPIGISVVFIINFIHQVHVSDINHQQSVEYFYINRKSFPINCFLLVTGVGDPHINTIDNGRYTCHIRGIYIFARTTNDTTQQANNNDRTGNITGDSLLYPSDLFSIQVRSEELPPAMYYVERTQGKASVFTSYAIIAMNNTYNISKINDKFGKRNFNFNIISKTFFIYFSQVSPLRMSLVLII